MSHVGLPSVTPPLCSPQPRGTLAFALWHCWGVLVWQGGFVFAPDVFLSCWQIFHPETTDIYDKKNMPRVIYCIHALR